MKILIETIPHSDQRYSTVGDWQWKRAMDTNISQIDSLIEPVLVIKVSAMSDWRYEALAGIHEAIEALLCKAADIDEAQVDNFDLGWEDNRVMGQEAFIEPGDHPNAPYHRQHKLATAVEIQLAHNLDVNWTEYEREVNAL